MERNDKRRVEAIMARMAAGDEAAAVTLYMEFGDAVRAAVRRVVRAQGATHLTASEIDGVALDVCLDLFRRAGSWDPDGGALPWVWAERRIRSMVAAAVGHYGAPFDDTARSHVDVGGVAFVGDDSGDDEALDRLAARSPECALLRDALASVASERNRRVFLLFTVQQDAGDPSPSVTVGRAVGLSPDNVRQIARRVRSRLTKLAASDARYAALGDLALLRSAPRAA